MAFSPTDRDDSPPSRRGRWLHGQGAGRAVGGPGVQGAPVVATEAWPNVAWTRWIGALRSKAWVAWAWRSQWGLTPPLPTRRCGIPGESDQPFRRKPISRFGVSDHPVAEAARAAA